MDTLEPAVTETIKFIYKSSAKRNGWTLASPTDGYTIQHIAPLL
jgi:hypothetical protein